ncbi:MAG: hypothetical protein IKN09_04145 [Clostridia bacterium]|nr:hypothetical protein [Clostridia bacterium]MBR4260537.1 hypothetical protein [Clostridia bacterium]
MKIKERKNFQEKDNNFYTAYTKNGRRLFDVVAHEEKFVLDEYLHRVSCLVINERNEVLMGERKDKSLTPGKVDLISANVKGYDTGMGTVIKELESLGINNVLGSEIKRVNHLAKPLTMEYGNRLRNYLVDFYCLKVKRENFKINLDQFISMKWVKLETAEKLIKMGKTILPKESNCVNYDKIFENTRKFCLKKDKGEDVLTR